MDWASLLLVQPCQKQREASWNVVNSLMGFVFMMILLLVLAPLLMQ